MIRWLWAWLLCRPFGHDPRVETLWERDGVRRRRRICRDCRLTLNEWSEPVQR